MKVINNQLYLGNYSLVELANKYGTPLYVYDEAGVVEKMQIFKRYFRSSMFECEVVFASKAFLAPYLCKLLEREGLGIDAVSAGDLYLINKSRFPMDKVILHGNNKSIEELELGIDLGLEYIVVDSYTELESLEALAKIKNKKVKTLFRMNPGISADTHVYIETSSLSSKFGESIYDDELLEKIVNIYKKSNHLILDGFHSHIGSQISNPKSFVLAANTMLDFIKKFEEKYMMQISTLDLGGGFAIKYLETDSAIDLEFMLQEIIKTVEERVKKDKLNIKKLMIEPGRSIVGDNGFTLYKSGGTKKTYSGKKYVFIDGGMADNIRPALYDAKYTVEIANKINANAQSSIYDVVGKCCESGDIIAKEIKISDVKKDDIIIVYATGAYTYSMSMNYNGLTRGAVIFVNGDKITEAIRKETYKDLVKTCNFEV